MSTHPIRGTCIDAWQRRTVAGRPSLAARRRITRTGKHRAPAVRHPALALTRDEFVEARPGHGSLERLRLRIELSNRREPIVVPELRAVDRALQHPNRLVIDLERHRERMAVLAAMRHRK